MYTLPSGDPATSISLVDGTTARYHPFTTCIYDSGSNVNILSREYCDKTGIQYGHRGGITMMTSSGDQHSTAGRVTAPVHFRLPGCDGDAVNITLELQVVDAPKRSYDILLGTPFMNALATSVDVPTATMRYQPRWLTELDASGPVCSIPITLTTTNPSQEYCDMLAPLRSS